LVHKIDEVVTISVSVASKYPVNRVEFFVNNELLEQKTSEPFSISFTPNSLTSVLVNNIITVVVYDSIFNKGVHTTQLQIEQ